jgi:hypothetical protein
MIVYNVTCNMLKSESSEWLDWMKNEHIPEVMQTGCFISFKILKLLSTESTDEDINYAIQYTCENVDTLERYRRDFGPALMQKTFAKYGESVLAYRSVLEIIE